MLLGRLTVVVEVVVVDVDVDEDDDAFLLELGVIVDSCSCINIMWSPSLIVRFKGDLPDKKSFTCF